MIRVMVAARSAIVRAGLTALIAERPTLSVISTSSDPDILLQQIETIQPEVMLIDIDDADDLPGLLSELVSELDLNTQPAIVLLADEPDAAWIGTMLRSGVRGILPKATIASEIIAALEAVATGLIALHPDITEALLPTLPTLTLTPSSPHSLTPSLPHLTPREIEVLQMLAEGMGNKAIARRLTISEHTVKFHISSIFSKLQVSSRTEAVILGTRLGLILL
ncbi:MAG: response regulator transcription factor [Cyanobacteria bacterium CRU_2_1]|nr:response regulator transcription factor [Cyanobacteria bacterium RU_5_0]NJR59456.1 response regulator transcription factor [Cyanobacteria bacterium CRU_2_1]